MQDAPVLTAQHIGRRGRAERLKGLPAHLKTHARFFFSVSLMTEWIGTGQGPVIMWGGFEKRSQKVSSKSHFPHSLMTLAKECKSVNGEK